MTRPLKPCNVQFCPKAKMFRPTDGECMGMVTLSREETEAMRLKNVQELDQTAAAKEMGISQSTFQRLLTSANKKIAEALTYGKAIQILPELAVKKLSTKSQEKIKKAKKV